MNTGTTFSEQVPQPEGYEEPIDIVHKGMWWIPKEESIRVGCALLNQDHGALLAHNPQRFVRVGTTFAAILDFY